MIEKDHAVADVLLNPVARKRLVALLAGDDDRDTLVLEPPKQPPQLRAKNRLVRQAGKECLHRVQHHPLGADLLDHRVKADEQAFQVVLAGLLDLTTFHVDIVDDHLFSADQAVDIKAQRRDILGEFLGRLFEGHEDAWLVELGDAADDELHGQQCLTRSGAATDQRGLALGQPALHDFI